MDECKERRDAELEFVESAYSPDEAWCERTSLERIIRRLHLPDPDDDDEICVTICLRLTLPSDYPSQSSLQIDVSLDEESGRKSSALLKSALNALPRLLAACRTVASENQGEESVFLVFNQAEDWIQHDWPSFCQQEEKTAITLADFSNSSSKNHSNLLLGRRLIYSHHIISKIKRADIKSLASHYKLTGFMKIGWPGLLIIEGREKDCISFYDEIRQWNWKYLVVRGEQQEAISNSKSSSYDDDLDAHRKFHEFLEVQDMSLVAQHCRTVRLEALFRTSMKLYDNSTTTHDSSPTTTSEYYGAMVHVDHMNNPKAYRKWIRKTSQETDCYVLIKQSYKNQDYNNNNERPKIIVGILGETRGQVSGFLKRWRTSRVDVDSRGKPCYERQMAVAVEGTLPLENPSTVIDWDGAMSEESVTVPQEHLAELLQTVGGEAWNEAFQRIHGVRVLGSTTEETL
jgi:hypothetical protein